MKTIFKMLVFVLLSMTISCNETASDAENQTEQTQQNQQATTKLNQVAAKTVMATYQEATVYAGRTDYLFEDEIGGMLLIEGNTYDEEPTIELPDNMLETGEEIEGPPGANPELIGKKFKLSYNADGAVFKIELAKK